MAWRFKASIYKNAALKFPKREELISELPVGGLSPSSGNHIKSSCSYVVFNTDLSAGGSLGYLPVNTSGKQNRSNIPLIQAHSDFVTDFDFSPFDDYLLATGSLDNTIKIWLLPEADSTAENITSPIVTLPSQDKKIENVLWHTTADGILAASTHKSIKIFDVKQSKEVYELEGHNDVVQSICWDGNGRLLASSCKDKKLRIFDPRSSSIAQEGPGCPSIKESRVLWLSDKNNILTTGFNENRNRIVQLYDSRSIEFPLETKSYDTSSGVLMPLYDADTGMLFLAGKGDATIRYLEINNKDPYLVENNIQRTEQVKGIAMVPKRGVNVMTGEVSRIMILAHNSIIPTPVIIPRKSYREFHDDLYPDTSNGEPSLTAEWWIGGDNKVLPLMSLNPSKRPQFTSRHGALFNKTSTTLRSPDKSSTVVSNGVNNSSKESTPDKPVITKPKLEIIPSSNNHQSDNKSVPEIVITDFNVNNDSSAENNTTKINEDKPEKPDKTAKTFSGVRQTKFRHLTCTLLHRSQFIENIRHQDRTVPGESDLFHANNLRCVVPIEGGGGLLSVIELCNKGKQPNDVPYIQNGSKVTDYVWDPFDDSRLVVCCDDAKIRVWKIPEGGLTETLTEPEMYLRGHTEKMYFVRFHPKAKDLLVTSSYDMKVKFWDLSDGSEIEEMEITEHSDQVFCCAWSPDGKLLATICKDGLIRIYEPRKSLKSIKMGPGPGGSRGARCGWALGGKYIFTSGFSKGSQRKVNLYSVEDLSHLNTVTLDTSPAILMPYYDEDSSTLFLTGRGDQMIRAYEIASDEPYFFELATGNPGGVHQALSFEPKYKCAVKDVEFARVWRLTKTTVEPITFTVPRVKKEYFQDDLFPDTKVTWEPVLSCSDWLAGQDGTQKTISLRPENMKLLSEAPVLPPKPKKYESFNVETYKTDDQKKEELLSAMNVKLTLQDDPLPQDLTEGVDEEEWDDY